MQSISTCSLMRLLSFGLVLLAPVISLLQAVEEDRPDVVFIIVDDLNDWIGAMGGHPQSKTPNLDALAEEGVLFMNAHCNAPQCGPSRTSFLHGLYPKSTGKYFNSARRPAFLNQPMQDYLKKRATESIHFPQAL